MVTVSAVDVTREQRSSSGVGGGLVGVLAMTAIDAFSDNTQNDWRYLIAKVVLEPIRAGT